jgi:hypothetical protein
MKTSIVLFSICALGVVALGAGYAPIHRAAAHPGAASAVSATAADEIPVAAAARSRVLPVLPTVTVVASRAEIAALDAPVDGRGSVMIDAAVDQAASVIARPINASLPRARLGNPFYDFAHGRRSTAATE